MSIVAEGFIPESVAEDNDAGGSANISSKFCGLPLWSAIIPTTRVFSIPICTGWIFFGGDNDAEEIV